MTDEKQWDRLKNEYHITATEFLNFLQGVSVKDLEKAEVRNALKAMRYNLVDSFLHVFLFVEDAAGPGLENT